MIGEGWTRTARLGNGTVVDDDDDEERERKMEKDK